ncbi:hypothetical protein ILUMI_06429 [Ignelater luminosus]|uniref:OPA3-like protein n=1 Tax=Ignelater luminosus TaxID=2038154 RepID=A0A8K0GCK7_IGNLU|nr:hypothetical protein ILUMI_06429 [Ignelater luminosus]
MVIGAFPAAKLGALLLKQISKPIANYIKHHAKTSPVFRTYVCMPPAQFYNWCEVKTKMWILNLGKPVNIPVLNEAMAIELGANLLGEGVIFVIAAGILINEYSRSSKKEAAREVAKQEEMQSINLELQELFFQMEEQRVQIKELLRTVAELETQVPQKPTSLCDRNKDKDQDRPKRSPPSSPGSSNGCLPPSSSATSESLKETEDKSSSLVMKATKIIETDFLYQNPHRNKGILTVALHHLYKDVYKLPSSMYSILLVTSKAAVKVTII